MSHIKHTHDEMDVILKLREQLEAAQRENESRIMMLFETGERLDSVTAERERLAKENEELTSKVIKAAGIVGELEKKNEELNAKVGQSLKEWKGIMKDNLALAKEKAELEGLLKERKYTRDHPHANERVRTIRIDID